MLSHIPPVSPELEGLSHPGTGTFDLVVALLGWLVYVVGEQGTPQGIDLALPGLPM